MKLQGYTTHSDTIGPGSKQMQWDNEVESRSLLHCAQPQTWLNPAQRRGAALQNLRWWVRLGKSKSSSFISIANTSILTESKRERALAYNSRSDSRTVEKPRKQDLVASYPVKSRKRKMHLLLQFQQEDYTFVLFLMGRMLRSFCLLSLPGPPAKWQVTGSSALYVEE